MLSFEAPKETRRFRQAIAAAPAPLQAIVASSIFRPVISSALGMPAAVTMARGTAAYDAVAYPGFAYPQAHPVRLATNATLRGLQPPDVATARVLELGCGDGGHLIPIAAAYPGMRCVGIDASGAAIARGAELVAVAGLDNVELLEGDLAALPETLGTLDYITAHGVYSWVPDAVRDDLLAAIRRHLAPERA